MNLFKSDNIQFTRPFSFFIEAYPIEQLHPGFKLLNKFCTRHRPVKGDGNCFYRAFSFLYLLNLSSTSFEEVFPLLQLKSYPTKIAVKQMDFVEKVLREGWDSHIKFIGKTNDQIEKENILQKLFNHLQSFDKAIITYFRLSNFCYITVNQQKWLPYFTSHGAFLHYIQKIPQFNHQSEGVEIASLCQLFEVKLTIFCVNADGLQQITYQQQKYKYNQFFMFYRPGHYDIIYPDRQYVEKKKVKAMLGKVKNFLLGDFSKGPMSTVWFQLLMVLAVGYICYLMRKGMEHF